MKWKQNGVDFSALCLTVLWGVEVTSSCALGVLAAVKKQARAEKFSKKFSTRCRGSKLPLRVSLLIPKRQATAAAFDAELYLHSRNEMSFS